MAFGKRAPGTIGRTSAAAQAFGAVPMASPIFVERISALKEHLEDMQRAAIVVADAIRNAAGIDTGPFESMQEPDSYPVCVAGLGQHFNFLRDGKLRHAVYAYSRPGGELDRTAQLLMFDLASAALALDATCISAYHDGALKVALQSDAMRDNVDRIIVLSGFFAGLLDNLLVSTTARNAGSPLPRVEKLQQRMLGWNARAMQAMLDSSRFETLYPDIGWPVFLYETEVGDHEGQLVVNQVYLPKEIAAPVMETIAREQAKARRAVQAGMPAPMYAKAS